jgi:hypothetical protein
MKEVGSIPGLVFSPKKVPDYTTCTAEGKKDTD